MSDERLTELEVRASLAEDALEELNRSVFRQQCEIDRLKEQLRFLYRELKAGADAAPDQMNPADEVPPHY
ncbi:MAG: SlyX family protein [Candidatus Accumulibacter sp.]|jgi:SlyX protein|nr:SlyX family protein [Accumulibacter sp.]